MLQDYQQMRMGRLRRIAATEGEHQDEAARAYVDRCIEIEADTRLWHDHAGVGHHPFSPLAHIGEQPGGGSAAAEPLLLQYERSHELSKERQAVRRFVLGARLPPRQLLALLIRGAKSYPRARGELARSYDDIARNLPPVAQALGFGPVAAMGDLLPRGGHEPVYGNGQAIKQAAQSGRVALILLAKASAKKGRK